jgi:cation transporter-like permease
MTTRGNMLSDGGNLVANADLSAKQGYAVKQTTTARNVGLASTGGESITGILLNNPLSGEAADVCFSGLCPAVIGAGGVTSGDALQTEAATGKLITQTSTNAKVAVACETGAAGDTIMVRVVPTPG